MELLKLASRNVFPRSAAEITHYAHGSLLYVGVGSNSNITENGMQAEENRAAISEVDWAAGRWRIFRNRSTQSERAELGTADECALWTVVNERDELGPNLVPDYLTSVKRRLLRLRHLTGPGLCRQGRGSSCL